MEDHECIAMRNQIPLWDAEVDIAQIPKNTKLSPWFLDTLFHPKEKGYYEVMDAHDCPTRYRIQGSRFRYWDGSQWLSVRDGTPSVVGKKGKHGWRGTAFNLNAPKAH